MHKKVLVLILGVCCLLPLQAFAAGGVTYRGLTPGISTLADTLRVLGRPISKVYRDDRIVCKYRTVLVNIPKKTEKVQYIIITDPDFRDVNGIGLGTSYAAVQKKLKVNGTGNSIVDMEKAIGYVFDKYRRVSQIIYGIIR
ncbi:hypothetical protein JWJ90_00625 [Desulfobulbus rhabdoformis]|uniref:hypothetical protein n=1 Tax=Desulfobulbus rhabdoformis TaxID=34032 RepID=UPI001965EBAB|nr:hypothetical protein [Desulfobulbus rhabdoformis]MBM9612784.1 hypothetical protein [Desulfobulbus rhabdoformis]